MNKLQALGMISTKNKEHLRFYCHLGILISVYHLAQISVRPTQYILHEGDMFNSFIAMLALKRSVTTCN